MPLGASAHCIFRIAPAVAQSDGLSGEYGGPRSNGDCGPSFGARSTMRARRHQQRQYCCIGQRYRRLPVTNARTYAQSFTCQPTAHRTVQDAVGMEEEQAPGHVQGHTVAQLVPIRLPVVPRYGIGHVAARHQLQAFGRRLSPFKALARPWV